MAITIIINPKSGTGGRDLETRGRLRADLARRVLAGAGEVARIEVTRHAGHAASLAREAVSSGARLILVWGGDGTMNEVGSALAFGSVPLGIVPGGSGNGLARALGISHRPERAIRDALHGRERTIDAGELDGRLFFNLAGVGFDAHVARLFNARRGKRGFLAYLQTSFTELLRYESRPYMIRADGETIARRALMVVVANGTQYGNGARVAPDARLDDGVLDLVVVEPSSPMRDILRSRHMFDGTLARRAGILCRRVGAVSIASEAGPLAYHVDGECHESAEPLAVRIRPAALKVRVP